LSLHAVSREICFDFFAFFCSLSSCFFVTFLFVNPRHVSGVDIPDPLGVIIFSSLLFFLTFSSCFFSLAINFSIFWVSFAAFLLRYFLLFVLTTPLLGARLTCTTCSSFSSSFSSLSLCLFFFVLSPCISSVAVVNVVVTLCSSSAHDFHRFSLSLSDPSLPRFLISSFCHFCQFPLHTCSLPSPSAICITLALRNASPANIFFISFIALSLIIRVSSSSHLPVHAYTVFSHS
jgi:hypothetical protein